MKKSILNILKKIHKCRELSAHEIDVFIEKRFNDHRDYYPLSFLMKDKYIQLSLYSDDKNISENCERTIAYSLYAMMQNKHEVMIEGIKFTNSTNLKSEKFHCMVKTDFYFSEQSEKRKDRIIGIVIAACIAIFSSCVTVVVKDLHSQEQQLSRLEKKAEVPQQKILHKEAANS
ncbi:hypothetical protein [Endozoicomonas sp. SCSIO W0465]|uniref:hypothetical protein n=1 Tax=Endozoicomonas sp. SCSIO W0465 TaxID=2918516 RepID=UPI002074D2B7|nr:hypothetical protein [Endozoicomonas sp. SCSIO W0465]USE38696.1 hypothetical protein MJO57_11290 [Endozoicomonas sp. SCSIO W0465]